VRRFQDETGENAEVQSFWTEFLGIFGIDRKRVNAIFEDRAHRSDTGGRGRIDMFWPGQLHVFSMLVEGTLEVHRVIDGVVGLFFVRFDSNISGFGSHGTDVAFPSSRTITIAIRHIFTVGLARCAPALRVKEGN